MEVIRCVECNAPMTRRSKKCPRCGHLVGEKPRSGTMLVALDFETTGLDPGKGAEIIEIGAYKFNLEGDRFDNDTFQVFCKPKREIPSYITKINGIKNRNVKNAPDLVDGWSDFLDWAGDTDAFVAHNAPFEAKFIDSIYYKHGRTTPDFLLIDTLMLARRRISGSNSFKLVDLSSHLGIRLKNAHRAVDDAVATGELLMKISETYQQPVSSVMKSGQALSEIASKQEATRQESRSVSEIHINLSDGDADSSDNGKGPSNGCLVVILVLILVFSFL